MSFRGTGASQTFDSLNAFILKGEPAQGLGLLYDSLLAGSADEPDAAYGLIAESLEYPDDRSWVIFNMRPEATLLRRRARSPPRTWSSPGRCCSRRASPPTRSSSRTSRASRRSTRTGSSSPSSPGAAQARPAVARRRPLDPAEALLRDRRLRRLDADAAGRLRPLRRRRRVEPGKSIRYCKNPDYWGEDLPVNVGTNNFDCFVYEYFADNTAAFEALKVGNYLFHQEFFSILWATAYDFPALEKGWVKREELARRPPLGHPGLLVQPAPREVPGPARPRGDRADVQLRVDERDAVLRPLRAHRQLLRELADAGRGPAARARSSPSSRSSATGCRPRSSPSRPGRPPVNGKQPDRPRRDPPRLAAPRRGRLDRRRRRHAPQRRRARR